MRLKDKVALVTGGSRGIGKAVAIELSREGANIILNYVDDEKGINLEDANMVSEEIKQMGRGSLVAEANVTDVVQVYEMVKKAVDKFGRLDILVNNAGIKIDGTIKNLDIEAWKEVISVNLTGVFNCTKAVLNYMLSAGHGRIISISSVAGQIGAPGASNYAASKAGVMAFTKSVAREVASKGITVNAIAPGGVDTEMFSSIQDKYRESFLKQIPMGRLGKPNEIAKLVVYLASEDADYITGQVIHINGGMYM